MTLDKLPGAFWVQALAVRAFGFHSWVIFAPQAIEGALTVVVLYRAVSRLAGLIAAVLLVPAVASAGLVLRHEGAFDTPFEPAAKRAAIWALFIQTPAQVRPAPGRRARRSSTCPAPGGPVR